MGLRNFFEGGHSIGKVEKVEREIEERKEDVKTMDLFYHPSEFAGIEKRLDAAIQKKERFISKAHGEAQELEKRHKELLEGLKDAYEKLWRFELHELGSTDNQERLELESKIHNYRKPPEVKDEQEAA